MRDDLISLNHFIFQAARNHLEKEGYKEVIVPRLVRASGACENIDTLFEVSVDKNHTWFNSPGYLAQTGQLYLESLVPKIGKVYCSGPSFRAEPKVDNRHLIEFHMFEIELATDFKGLLKEIEKFITAIAAVAVSAADQKLIDLPTANRERLSSLPNQFVKITYDEAIELLKNLGEKIIWGDDISSDREKKLLAYFDQQPFFITHYPDPMWDHGQIIEVEKFFNMLPDPEKPGRVQSSDLILPFGGESVGSAARVHNVEVMVDRLKKSRMFNRLLSKGGSFEDFGWYVKKLKTEGGVPHAGCGFGMARILQWVLGETDIRNAVTFPSTRATII